MREISAPLYHKLMGYADGGQSAVRRGGWKTRVAVVKGAGGGERGGVEVTVF